MITNKTKKEFKNILMKYEEQDGEFEPSNIIIPFNKINEVVTQLLTTSNKRTFFKKHYRLIGKALYKAKYDDIQSYNQDSSNVFNAKSQQWGDCVRSIIDLFEEDYTCFDYKRDLFDYVLGIKK